MTEPAPEQDEQEGEDGDRLLLGTLTIREYMTIDGDSEHTVDADGDLPLSQYLGLMELAKMWLIAEHDIDGRTDEDPDDYLDE